MTPSSLMVRPRRGTSVSGLRRVSNEDSEPFGTNPRSGAGAGAFAAPTPATARNTVTPVSASAARNPFIRDLYVATAAEVPQRRLFDGDGLRQVPRLVDVQTPQAGESVGEELERHDRERRLEERVRARHVDHVVGVVLDVLVAVGRDRDHVRAPRP